MLLSTVFLSTLPNGSFEPISREKLRRDASFEAEAFLKLLVKISVLGDLKLILFDTFISKHL